MFTLNSVPLASEEAVAGGVARNFISRDLLEAHNLDDALEVGMLFPLLNILLQQGKKIHAWLDLLSITWSPKGCKFFHIWSCFLLLISFVQRARERHLSVGHNYNIMDINERKIVTVETASNARSSTRNIAMEPFFHANMYLHLQVPQVLMGYGIARGGPFFLFLS